MRGEDAIAVGRGVRWKTVLRSRHGARLGLLVGASLALIASSMAIAPAADSYVYWAIRGGGFATNLGRANLDGSSLSESFIIGAAGPVGVAVDGSHVYWANTFGSKTTIGRANLDGTGVNQSFITGANTPCGVAVDGAHIYWANNGSTTIGRANLDGTGVNQEFITGANGPCGVAVDGSHVYWTNEKGTTIGRADLNGKNVEPNYVAELTEPVGVAVNGSFIYWGNNKFGKVGRAPIGGGPPEPNFITGEGACTDFPAVDGTYIYWLNDCQGSIARANLDGTAVNENFIATGANPGGLAVDGLAPLGVSVTGPGAGTVTGPGISCPSTCAANVSFGQQVTLSATPAAGSSFAGWSGACAGTGSCTLQAAATNSVTATFIAAHVPPSSSPPAITAVHQSSTRWRAGSKPARISAKKKTPTGTTFSFSLNESANVGLTFIKRLSGRKVGKRCLAVTPKNRRGKTCTRTQTAGKLAFTGHAGTNKVAFQGRLAAARLGPGTYSLTITAANAAGEHAGPQSLSFTIVK